MPTYWACMARHRHGSASQKLSKTIPSLTPKIGPPKNSLVLKHGWEVLHKWRFIAGKINVHQQTKWVIVQQPMVDLSSQLQEIQVAGPNVLLSCQSFEPGEAPGL